MSGADKYRVYRGTTAGGQIEVPRDDGDQPRLPGQRRDRRNPGGERHEVGGEEHLELKNAQRVTVDGNLLENSWAAGQSGYAIVLTPRNSGSAPWTRVQNVTFTNNIVRHVAGVVNIAGFDDSDPTQRTEHITFRNNLFDDVNVTAYGTEREGAAGR